MKFIVQKEYIALGLLILAVSLVNLIWIIQDTRPQPVIDPYAQKTLQFVDGLKKHGMARFPQLVNKMSVGPRPPLYQLCSVPFIRLFGRSVDAMLCINILFGIILLICTYKIGKIAGNSKTGLLAAWLVATYPPIAISSRVFQPHSIMPACVALSTWLLLVLCQTRSSRVAWLFGVSLGFGFLIHPDILGLLSVPSAVIVLYIIFFQAEPRVPKNIKFTVNWVIDKLLDPFVINGLLPAAIIALGLAAIWYVPHLEAVKRSLMNVAKHWSTFRCGFKDVPYSFWYVRTMPGVISYVFTSLLALGLIISLLGRRLYPRVIAIIFVCMYTVSSWKAGPRAWMNFAAVLPVAATLTAIFIVAIRKAGLSPKRSVLGRRVWKSLFVFLLVLCIGVSVLNFTVVTWGIPPHCKGVVRALGAQLDTACSWRLIMAICPNSPRDEDWQLDDILRRIYDDWGGQERECNLALVSWSIENFNQSTFRYCFVRDFSGAGFDLRIGHIIGYPQRWQVNWLTGDYIIYISEMEGALYTGAVASFLKNPNSIFGRSHEEIASFSLPNEWTVRLIKRTQPLTLEEALGSIEMLDIPDSRKDRLREQVRELPE